MKATLRRFLGIFAVFLFMMAMVQSYARCPCENPKPPKQNESCEKIYVDPSQVNIRENQIWVMMENQPFKTQAIFSDGKGIFIRDYYTGDCQDGFWQCRTCGACNENYYLWCRTCGGT
ncbi:MAG TPA: hypothetical protein VJ112_04525 [Rhabdochlamydiaceae bacterium]|nr:hypothetical protein [Rhabdochlamydiaceae bacterium]